MGQDTKSVKSVEGVLKLQNAHGRPVMSSKELQQRQQQLENEGNVRTNLLLNQIKFLLLFHAHLDCELHGNRVRRCNKHEGPIPVRMR